MDRPPFPAVIDSSLLSHWRSCRRKTYLESFEHWKPKHHSVHLHAGASFAKGLEVARTAFYVDGKSEQDARALGMEALVLAYGDFECPPDSAKSCERMMGAFAFYFDNYPMPTDKAQPAKLPGGRLGIEFNFAEPIDVLHPTTGDPLIYCGRFDMIADYAGAIYGDDEKTTSQLGPTWSRQWDLRSQFTAYTWGARRAGIKLDGFIVRGVSILKTKYDTQQAITYRPQWMVDRWYDEMLQDVKEMIQSWETNNWRHNLDEACNAYGGCSFKNVCLEQPEKQIVWLRQGFERRAWDPITRIETPMTDRELGL